MGLTRTWKWRLADGDPIVATIELPARIESVAVGATVVSRSEPGGQSGGHPFPHGGAAAVVTFDADGHGAELTLDGDWVPPEVQPSIPVTGPLRDRIRAAPPWTWTFVALALASLVASRGAFIPSVIALAAAAACVAVAIARIPTELKVVLSFCLLGTTVVPLALSLFARRGALGDGAVAHLFGGGDPCRVAPDELLLLGAAPGASPRGRLRLPRATCPRLDRAHHRLYVRGSDGALLYQHNDGVHRFDRELGELGPRVVYMPCAPGKVGRTSVQIDTFVTAPDSDRIAWWCGDGTFTDATGPHALPDGAAPIALGRGGTTLLFARDDVADRYVLVDPAYEAHDVTGLPSRHLPARVAPVVRAHDDGFWLLVSDRDDLGSLISRQLWLVERDGHASFVAVYADLPDGTAVDRLASNGDVYAACAGPDRVMRLPVGGDPPEVVYEGAPNRLTLGGPILVAPP